MKISIIGIGKLGICLALNLERSGYDVLGMDINVEYVKSINDRTLLSSEPNVSEYLKESKRLRATTDFSECLEFSDTIFLMVSTPSLENGKYDHSQIESVLSKIEEFGLQENRKTLIVGCTTYPGYCESIKKRLDSLNFSIVYNPEFIAQGDIIKGQLYPDMVLIGESDTQAGNIVSEIHERMCLGNPTMHRLSLTEAELVKLSINCFVTTKISFANMVGDLCNKLSISHSEVLNSIGSDSRIGNKYLGWGYGFGGPCFPRDNRALGILCSENGIEPKIPDASDEYNALHSIYHTEHILKEEVKENKIIMDGVSYKKGSVIIEESQQLKVADLLIERGVEVTIIDREEVLEQVKAIRGEKFKYSKR